MAGATFGDVKKDETFFGNTRKIKKHPTTLALAYLINKLPIINTKNNNKNKIIQKYFLFFSLFTQNNTKLGENTCEGWYGLGRFFNL